MNTTVKSLLKEIAAKIVASGASVIESEKTAVLILLKELTEQGVAVNVAYNAIFGSGKFEMLASEIYDSM